MGRDFAVTRSKLETALVTDVDIERSQVARPIRVLFLCTKNSARSQMAEALLAHEGGGRFEVASAGATPAMSVDPMTFEVLDQLGIDWRAHRPKGFDAIQSTEWEVVVTVCDRAREACPVLPGRPVFAHWSLEDPVEAPGTPEQRRPVFLKTAQDIRVSIRRFAALDFATEAEDELKATVNACFGQIAR